MTILVDIWFKFRPRHTRRTNRLPVLDLSNTENTGTGHKRQYDGEPNAGACLRAALAVWLFAIYGLVMFVIGIWLTGRARRALIASCRLLSRYRASRFQSSPWPSWPHVSCCAFCEPLSSVSQAGPTARLDPTRRRQAGWAGVKEAKAATMSATMSVFSIEFPSFEKASHRTPIRRALSAFAFPNAAIFRRSHFRPSDFSSHGARHSWGILSWILRDQLHCR
jgi:hypothetical protein